MGGLISHHWAPSPPAPPLSTIYILGPARLICVTSSFFVLLCGLFHAAHGVFRSAFPYAPPLSPREARALSSFSASFLHHLIVVPLSLWSLLQFGGGGGVPWGAIANVAPLTLAYLLMDSALFAVPEALDALASAVRWRRFPALGDFAYLLHHALGVAVVAGVLAAPARLLRWVPTLLCTEASSIPFCASYVLRKATRRHTAPHARGAPARVLEGLFVALFIATRVVMLLSAAAAFSSAGAHAGDRALVGAPGLAVLWLLCGMQLWWLWGILKKCAKWRG